MKIAIKNQREKEMLHANMVAIAVNLVIAVVKGVTGILVGSISFITDAFSNISDCGSCVMSIINTLLANKKPDKEHPFGYGRIEYINGLFIALVVVVAGIKTFESSFPHIFHPVQPKYTWASLAVISITIVLKILDGRHAVTVGRKYDVGSLVAAGSNAFLNAAMTGLMIVCAWISMTFHITIDGYVGCLISIVIFHTGWKIVKSSLDKIVGRPVDYEFSKKLLNTIKSTPGILDAHDLIIHNYGPTQNYGTVNVELNANMTIGEAYPIVRKLQHKIYDEFKINIVFGFYAVNCSNTDTQKLVDLITKLIQEEEHITSFHAPFIDNDKNELFIDLELDYDGDWDEILTRAHNTLQQGFPEFTINIVPDSAF